MAYDRENERQLPWAVRKHPPSSPEREHAMQLYELEQDLKKLAIEELGIHLDGNKLRCHEISVGELRAALEAAYRKGAQVAYARGVEKGKVNG